MNEDVAELMTRCADCQHPRYTHILTETKVRRSCVHGDSTNGICQCAKFREPAS